MNVRLLSLLSLMALAACTPRNIPGTQIPDTPDARAILNVMERYRSAVEAQDTQALMKVVSPDFNDNSGTETPEDDLTYANLPQALPALFARLKDAKVDLDVRRVDVQSDTATAIYYWNASWRMPTLGDKPQRASELQQMRFEKVQGEWKIVSGI